MSASSDFELQLLAEGQSLRRLARALVGGADAADDLVQEASLQALAKRERVGEHLPQWLRITVRNLAKTWRRRDVRRVSREWQTAALSSENGSCDPTATAMAAEVARDVAAAVQALDEPFRSAVVLRFWHGLLPEAIAEQLGVPRNTVRSRLQRGLERLRERLDARHGDRERWSVPLLLVVELGCQPVGAAASVGAKVVGGGLVPSLLIPSFLGAWMNAKLLIGVVLLVAVAGTIALRAPDPALRNVLGRVDPAPLTSAVSAAAEPVKNTERVPVPQTEDAATTADLTTSERAEVVAPRVSPWSVRLLVVDEKYHAVPDAEITVWARVCVGLHQHFDGTMSMSYAQRMAEPILQLRTDSTGRVSVVLDREVAEVEAQHDDVGCSDPVSFWHSLSKDDEYRLVLQAPRYLCGRVLLADGSPAAGAVVTTEARLSSDWLAKTATTPTVDPVPADALGAFRISVREGIGYSCRALLDGRETFVEEVFVTGRSLPEMTLAFPGTFAITGVVVDADGEPLGGTQVRSWRVLPDWPRFDPGRQSEITTANADDEGRFTLHVRQSGTYDVIAGKRDSMTSELVRVTPNAVRQRVNVRLVVPRPAPIQGRVVRQDGSPLPGVAVVAHPESGLDLGPHDAGAAMPTRRDLYPMVPAPKTAADGSFAMTVHPGTTWQLTVRLSPSNWRLSAAFPGVAAGSEDVVLTVSDAQLGGCIVGGVVAPSLAASNYELSIVDYLADGKRVSKSKASVTWTGDRFECEPLGLDRHYGLRVEVPRGDPMAAVLAPAFVGPFRTDRARLDYTVRLEPFGTLPVRVRRTGGAPLKAKLHASSAQEGLSEISGSSIIEGAKGEASVELARIVPGRNHVVLIDEAGTIHRHEVVVRSGPNPEFLIDLPPQ